MKWSYEHALLKSVEQKLLAYLAAEKNAFSWEVFSVFAILCHGFSTNFRALLLYERGTWVQTWLNMKWSHKHALLKSIESKLLAYLTAEKNAFLSKVFLSSCYCNQVVPEHHFQRDRFKIRTGEENLPKRRYEATSLVKIKRPKSIIKNNRPFHLTQIDWEAR